MSGPIENEWQEYKARVLPVDASPVQRQECRRAFFAGAMALQSVAFSMSDEPEVTEEDIALLKEISAELDSFAAGVATGEN